MARISLKIDRHARQLYGYLGFNSTGAEARGNSAVDLALERPAGPLEPVFLDEDIALHEGALELVALGRIAEARFSE